MNSNDIRFSLPQNLPALLLGNGVKLGLPLQSPPHKHLIVFAQLRRRADSDDPARHLRLRLHLLLALHDHLLGDLDPQPPRGGLLELERRAAGGGGAASEEGGEGEGGLEEIGREEEVIVAGEEAVVVGEGGGYLPDVEAVGAANHVLGELLHELGGGDGAVVDGDHAVGFDEADNGGGAVEAAGERGDH